MEKEEKFVSLEDAQKETGATSKKEIELAYLKTGKSTVYNGKEKGFYVSEIGFIPVEYRK